MGDMSSRPYWGLYELDFVFSTLVVSTPFATSCGGSSQLFTMWMSLQHHSIITEHC